MVDLLPKAEASGIELDRVVGSPEGGDGAGRIGVMKRIDPPHSEMTSAVRITTDGIEMIIVVVWKNDAIVVPMPVMNMWWAHTMYDRKPRKTSE